MHFPRLRTDRTSRHDLLEASSSRMTNYKSLKSVKYNPYPDEDKTPTHVIHKVTSKLGGMIKDLKSAVGSIFKSSPEDLNQSRNSENNAPKLPNVSNQAIMNIDFQGLSGLLNPIVNPNKPYGEPQPEVNHMELSFGEPDKNSSGNTLFSFRPINANQSDSRIIENLDLNGSGFEENREEEPKMNLLRILNFCHVLYEDTKERYTKVKPYGGSLRNQLIKGLPRPTPLRSTTPLIEFKYNKVSGKYEAHSSFKRKKRTGTEADPNFDLREHMMLSNSMLSEDGNRVERHAYKKKRVSQLEKTNEPKIHIDLKKYKKKGVASPAKKPASYANNLLETYETDETEEQELRKESPYKNKVFEEDKEDYWKKDTPKSSPTKGGKESLASKSTDHRSPVSSPIRTPKATPEKIDTQHKQNEKYHNLKINTANTNNDQSFSNPNFCLNDSKASENSEAQKDTENILNLPKTPTFNHNPKNSLFSNSKSEDSIEQPTEEPAAPAQTTSLFSQLPSSGGLFSNLAPAVVQENKEETVAPVPSNNNMSFCNDEPQPQVQNEEPPKAPEQQETTKVIPDFLKSIQRNQSVITNMESNPFLSKATSQVTSFGIDQLLAGGNVSRQESTATNNNNPFLQPTKPEAPVINFSNTTQNTNNLGLFNNINNNENNNTVKQNNLFANNFLSSPAGGRPRLESHSTSNVNSLFNKSTENSNGYESSNSMSRGINIFQNNHFQNDEMEKESSMGFQNNLFGGNNNNNNQSAGFGGNMNNNFSSMNNNMSNGNSLFQNNQMNNNNSFFGNNNNNNQSSGGFGGLFGGNNNNSNNNSSMMMSNQNNSSNNPFTGGNTQSQNNLMGSTNPFLNKNMGQQTQSASNFLGIGASAAAAPQQQERVFRKIIMPGSGNKKERAF